MKTRYIIESITELVGLFALPTVAQGPLPAPVTGKIVIDGEQVRLEGDENYSYQGNVDDDFVALLRKCGVDAHFK